MCVRVRSRARGNEAPRVSVVPDARKWMPCSDPNSDRLIRMLAIGWKQDEHLLNLSVFTTDSVVQRISAKAVARTDVGLVLDQVLYHCSLALGSRLAWTCIAVASITADLVSADRRLAASWSCERLRKQCDHTLFA